MATKIRPIVFRVNEPEGFVMNASNATIGNGTAGWESPSYPNAYDGNGKTAQIIVKESGCTFYQIEIKYSTGITAGDGPSAIQFTNPTDTAGEVPVGTYTATLSSNIAGGDYGKYLCIKRYGDDTAVDASFLSKFEIRIID